MSDFSFSPQGDRRAENDAATITLGHVHLKVSNLARAEQFYQAITGAIVTERIDGAFSFLSLGKAHHDIALQEHPGASAPSPHAVGLYHVAFELPTEDALQERIRKLKALQIPYTAVDHGISWAVYFSDPDGNGVELYVDRRSADNGSVRWEGKSRRLRV